MTIEIAEALYRIGSLAPSKLGELSTALLVAGADTPAVRELAWLTPNAKWRDAGKLFKRVLVELERPPLAG